MVMLQYSGGRHKSGYLIITDPSEVRMVTDGETVSCVHCEFTWIVQPGSGNARGFCLRCNAPTCNKPDCRQRCAPWEKQMEEMEAKQTFWRQLERLK